MAEDGQTEPPPSCPVDSLPPHCRLGCHKKPGEEVEGGTLSSARSELITFELHGFSLRSDLGSGPCVSDELFVSVPLSPVAAELQVETGHKGAKDTAALG